MAECPAIDDAPDHPAPGASPCAAFAPSPAPPPAPVPRTFCVKCAADLTPLPSVARFCNRCGSPLPARVFSPPPPQPPGPPTFPFRPPQILIAYARALFNLGSRYETALGSRRNLEEAARCYWKAARLSHAAAHTAANTPVDPDAPPPFASVHRSYPS
jgi:hypothetical protein